MVKSGADEARREGKRKPKKSDRPGPREIEIYTKYLGFLRDHGREPTAQEAFPWVRHMRGLRGAEKCVASKHKAEGVVSYGLVINKLRRLVKRVGGYLGENERTRALMGQLAEKATLAVLEVLDKSTRPADPAAVRAIGDIGIKALTLCGLSREEKGGGVSVEVNTNSFGQVIPETELEKARAERAALRGDLLARRGGVSLGDPSTN